MAITKTPETQLVLRCHVPSLIRCHLLEVFTLPQTMVLSAQFALLCSFFLGTMIFLS